MPVNYCTTLPNSTGVAAAISWFGSTSLPLNDFSLRALGVPAFNSGIFVYSPDQDMIPLGNGNLCLGTATQGFINRLPGSQADAFGLMIHQLDLDDPPNPLSFITPGSTWHFQAWFRDFVDAGFNFSDGLKVLFAP